jgi:hypothetical protein
LSGSIPELHHVAEPRSLSFLQALRHCGDVVRFVGIVLGDDRHGL